MITHQAPPPSGLAALLATNAIPTTVDELRPRGRWFIPPSGTPQRADDVIREGAGPMLEGLREPMFHDGAPREWRQWLPATRTDIEPPDLGDLYYQHAGDAVPRPFEFQVPGERRPWSRPGVDPSGLEWLLQNIRSQTL